MTRLRETRRARARRRAKIRTTLTYLAAVVLGVSAGIGIDAWIHL